MDAHAAITVHSNSAVAASALAAPPQFTPLPFARLVLPVPLHRFLSAVPFFSALLRPYQRSPPVPMHGPPRRSGFGRAYTTTLLPCDHTQQRRMQSQRALMDSDDGGGGEHSDSDVSPSEDEINSPLIRDRG